MPRDQNGLNLGATLPNSRPLSDVSCGICDLGLGATFLSPRPNLGVAKVTLVTKLG